MESSGCDVQKVGGRRKGKNRKGANESGNQNQQRQNKRGGGGAATIAVRDIQVAENSDTHDVDSVLPEAAEISVQVENESKVKGVEISLTENPAQQTAGQTSSDVSSLPQVVPKQQEEPEPKDCVSFTHSVGIPAEEKVHSIPGASDTSSATATPLSPTFHTTTVQLDPAALHDGSGSSHSGSSKQRRKTRDVCNSPHAEDERQDHVAMYPTLHQPHEVMLDPYPSLRIRSACVVEGRLVTCHKNGVRFFESYWSAENSSSEGTPTHSRSRSGKSGGKSTGKENGSSSGTGQLMSMSNVTTIALSGWKNLLPSAVLHQLSGGASGYNARNTSNSQASSQKGGVPRKPTLYSSKTAGNLLWRMVGHRDDFDLMDSYMCVGAPQVYLDYGATVDYRKSALEESGEVQHTYRRYAAVASGSDRTLHSVCVFAYGSNFLLHHELHRKNRITAMGFFTIALEPFHESRLTAFVVSVDEVGEVVIFDVEKNRAHRLMAVRDISVRQPSPVDGAEYTPGTSVTSDISQYTARPVEDDVVEDDNTQVINMGLGESRTSTSSPNHHNVPLTRMARVHPYRLSCGMATRVSLVGPCLELCNRCHNSNTTAESESSSTGVCKMTLYISSGSYDGDGNSELNVTSIRFRLSRNGLANYAEGAKAQQQASVSHGRFLDAFTVPFQNANNRLRTGMSTNAFMGGRGRGNSSFVQRTLNSGSLTVPIQPRNEGRRLSEEDTILIPWIETSELFPTAGIISDEIVVRESAPENVCTGTGIAMAAVPYQISRPNLILIARPRLRFWMLSGCTGTLMNLRRVYAENAPRTSVQPSADGSGNVNKKISNNTISILRQSFTALDSSGTNAPLRFSTSPPHQVQSPRPNNMIPAIEASAAHDTVTKSTFSTRSVREFTVDGACIGRHALSSDPETSWMLTVVLTNGGAVLLLGRSPIRVNEYDDASDDSDTDVFSEPSRTHPLEEKQQESTTEPVNNNSRIPRNGSVTSEKNGAGQLEQWLEGIVHTPDELESHANESLSSDIQMAVPIPLHSQQDGRAGYDAHGMPVGRGAGTQRKRRSTRRGKENQEASIGPAISKNNGNFVDETKDYTVLLHLFSSTSKDATWTTGSDGNGREGSSSSRSSSSSRRRRRSRSGRSRQSKGNGSNFSLGDGSSAAATAAALTVECLLPVPQRHCVLMLMDDLRTILCTTLPLTPVSVMTSTKQTEASTRTSRARITQSTTPPRSERRGLSDTPKDANNASTSSQPFGTSPMENIGIVSISASQRNEKNGSHPSESEGAARIGKVTDSPFVSPPHKSSTTMGGQPRMETGVKPSPTVSAVKTTPSPSALSSTAAPPPPPSSQGSGFGWFKDFPSIYDMNITRPIASAVLTALGGDSDPIPESRVTNQFQPARPTETPAKRTPEPTHPTNGSQPQPTVTPAYPKDNPITTREPSMIASAQVNRPSSPPRQRIQSSSPAGTHVTSVSTSSTRRSIDDSVSTCSTTATAKMTGSMPAMSIKLESFDKQQSRRRRLIKKKAALSSSRTNDDANDLPVRSVSPYAARGPSEGTNVSAEESASLMEYASRQASLMREKLNYSPTRRKKVRRASAASSERGSSKSEEENHAESEEEEDEEDEVVNDRYMQVLEVMRLLERIDEAEEPNSREALAFQEMKERSILLMRFLDERDEALQAELARKQSVTAAAQADAALKEYGVLGSSPTGNGFSPTSPAHSPLAATYHRKIHSEHSRYHKFCSFRSVEDQMLEVTGSARFAAVFRESTSFTTLTRGAPRSAAFSLPRHFDFTSYFHTLAVPTTVQNLQEGDRCKFEVEDLIVAHRRNVGALNEYLVITITQNQIREGWSSLQGSTNMSTTGSGESDLKRGGGRSGRQGKWVADPTFPYDIDGGESVDIGRVNRQPGIYATMTLEIVKTKLNGGVGNTRTVHTPSLIHSTADSENASIVTGISILGSIDRLGYGNGGKPLMWRWANPAEAEKWKGEQDAQLHPNDGHLKGGQPGNNNATNNTGGGMTRNNAGLSPGSPVGLPSSVRKPYRADNLPKELENWEVRDWMYAPRWPTTEESRLEKQQERAAERLTASRHLDDVCKTTEYEDDSDVEIHQEDGKTEEATQNRKKDTKDKHKIPTNPSFWSNTELKDSNVRCRQLTRLCMNCDVEQLKHTLTIRHQKDLEALRRELGL